VRTIIAGSRTITDPYVLIRALDNCGWGPTTIIGGLARGADWLGYQYSTDCNICYIGFPAKWKDMYGNLDKAAGFKRNIEMADKAEALIALWDGYSKGTAHMINTAKLRKLRIYIELV